MSDKIYYQLPGRNRASVDAEDFWTAKKLTAGLDTDDLDPESFAVACYDSNSVDELLNELSGEPNSVDLELWDITPQQWMDEMKLGLAALVREIEEHAEPM